MAKITLNNIKKSFGKVKAIDGISLEVKDKEFFVLFGPAGAGKTTLLNCIAGIEMPEEGTVSYDDQIMNLVEPAKRNVAMVFENYALYPQMTVYDNIASPLRSKLYREDEAEIKRRVENVAKMMKMEQLLDRLPSQLSNGQKQRVAMGRALVRTPNVFLMDEPLAHLDAKLRNAMRTELKEMQSSFGTTSIYVTHDFMEAMSLGDRIAIIDKGKVVQIGTPDDIYYLPCNEFVAQLMGDPEINIVSGMLKDNGETLTISIPGMEKEFALPADKTVFEKLRAFLGKTVDLALRPQHVKYSFEEKPGYVKFQVYSYESIGNKSVIETYKGKNQLRMIAPNGLTVKIDQDIYLDLQLENSLFFDSEEKHLIGRYHEAEIRAISAQQEEQ